MRRRSMVLGFSLLVLAAVLVARWARGSETSPVLLHVALANTPLAVAVDGRSGHVFVASAVSGSVLVLDAATGALLATVQVGGSPSAIVEDEQAGRAFVTFYHNPGDSAGLAAVLDTRSGAVLYTIQGDAGTLPIALGSGPPGRLFALTADAVRVLDATSGAPLHTFPLAPGQEPVALAEDMKAGRLFVAGYGSVSTLDAGSGAIVAAAPAGNAVRALAVDERSGRVFALSLGRQDSYGNFTGPGTVSVLDASSGRLLRTVSVGRDPTGIAVDVRRNRVFVADHDSAELSVLDAGSGRLLRTVQLDAGPLALAVDERAGHLLAIDDGEPVHTADRWSWLPSWLRARLPLSPSPPARHAAGGLTILDESRL